MSAKEKIADHPLKLDTFKTQRFLALISASKFDDWGLGSTWHLGGIYMCSLKFDSVHKNRYWSLLSNWKNQKINGWLQMLTMKRWGKENGLGSTLPTVWHKNRHEFFLDQENLSCLDLIILKKQNACWGWGDPNRMDLWRQRLKRCLSRAARKYIIHVMKQWSGAISVNNVWRN